VSQAGRLVDLETVLELLQGNTGGPVGPDGSNIINVIGSGAVGVAGNPGNNTLTISISGGTYTENFDVDVFSGTGVDPVVPNSLGTIAVTGGQIAASSTSNVIRTNTTLPNSYSIEIQRSTTAATSTVGDNGVCHFASSAFSVDSNGFVALAGGGQAIESVTVDANTAPGTNPVLPATNGAIVVTGAQIATGSTNNAIRTNSLAPNTYSIEIQRTTTAAASNVNLNGISHFDSSSFSVDSNGFVTLAGGSQAIDSIGVDANTAPGTNPVLPNTNGLVTVTGGQVASGTTANVIRTNSLAANVYEIQVQRSTTAATSTVGSNGVSHFDSDTFNVDSDGFVTFAGRQSLKWVVETSATRALTSNEGVFCNNAGGVTATLPATAAVGDSFELVAMNAGGFTINYGTGQSIQLGSITSTTTSGTISSTGIGDWIQIICNVANTSFFANVKQGNLNIT
jgi:hypothetical protein